MVRSPINLLVGSKAEYVFYSRRLLRDSSRVSRWVTKRQQLFGMKEPIVYVAGTGHLVPGYSGILEEVERRSGVLHYYDIPGLVIMPALEIAHEFADYLGIDPQWRYDSEERGLADIPASS